MRPALSFGAASPRSLRLVPRWAVLEMRAHVDATGVGQVVVRHDWTLARRAEPMCVLDHGRVIEEGAPAAVLRAPVHESTTLLLVGWRDL